MLRVLLADDHDVIRRGLRQILLDQYPSALIEEAVNGEDLVKKALLGEWDLIISDISMPVMSGLDALKRVKERFPLLPVLLLSTPSEEQYTARILDAGASGYLSKDSAPENLINAVQQILGGNVYIPTSPRM